MQRVVTGPPAPKKPPYVYQEFPKMKFHRLHKPVVVKNAVEEQKLGEGWADKEFPPTPELTGAAPCTRCEALTQKFEAAYRELDAKYRALVEEHNRMIDEVTTPSLSDLMAGKPAA
jgi:hypothetical protein